MRFERFLLPLGLLLGPAALAQNTMVPILPGMFGIDTCGAFLCGSPATVPGGSKGAGRALEAAFQPRGTRVPMGGQPAAKGSPSRVAALGEAAEALQPLPPGQKTEPALKTETAEQSGQGSGCRPRAGLSRVPVRNRAQASTSKPGAA